MKENIFQIVLEQTYLCINIVNYLWAIINNNKTKIDTYNNVYVCYTVN